MLVTSLMGPLLSRPKDTMSMISKNNFFFKFDSSYRRTIFHFTSVHPKWTQKRQQFWFFFIYFCFSRSFHLHLCIQQCSQTVLFRGVPESMQFFTTQFSFNTVLFSNLSYKHLHWIHESLSVISIVKVLICLYHCSYIESHCSHKLKVHSSCSCVA